MFDPKNNKRSLLSTLQNIFDIIEHEFNDSRILQISMSMLDGEITSHLAWSEATGK